LRDDPRQSQTRGLVHSRMSAHTSPSNFSLLLRATSLLCAKKPEPTAVPPIERMPLATCLYVLGSSAFSDCRSWCDGALRTAARTDKSIWMMGCGSGWEPNALLHLIPTAKVIGIDLAPAMVQAARRNLAAGALQSDPQRATRIFVQGDITVLVSSFCLHIKSKLLRAGLWLSRRSHVPVQCISRSQRATPVGSISLIWW
jgi:hypothetical protein